eukprot:CAMPEP_0181238304 /NCGR_PEP_ID=MMETSP1096-20121128/39260_1 /TAXON_ID=156174 ORGANISM="Chrysochromulina ericina, Strain CCMP281" /NCGR_SAMPLE_ID=MMETSP1096 /ASSEMBLY_ACC=CAM_ASM_000453 /LENGTH=227 /DNA_ID=CAMNT_0023333787 /DNA_START=12 /DNA_END=695 /DNA_ORIENTATION=+
MEEHFHEMQVEIERLHAICALADADPAAGGAQDRAVDGAGEGRGEGRCRKGSRRLTGSTSESSLASMRHAARGEGTAASLRHQGSTFCQSAVPTPSLCVGAHSNSHSNSHSKPHAGFSDEQRSISLPACLLPSYRKEDPRKADTRKGDGAGRPAMLPAIAQSPQHASTALPGLAGKSVSPRAEAAVTVELQKHGVEPRLLQKPPLFALSVESELFLNRAKKTGELRV